MKKDLPANENQVKNRGKKQEQIDRLRASIAAEESKKSKLEGTPKQHKTVGWS